MFYPIFLELCPRPTAIGHPPNPLFKRNQLIGGDLLEGLTQTAWPTHVNVHRCGSSQAKVQPRIVTGIEARLAQYRLRLRSGCIMDENASSHRSAVGLYAF